MLIMRKSGYIMIGTVRRTKEYKQIIRVTSILMHGDGRTEEES